MRQRTPEQQQIARLLVERWNLDPDKILFLKNGKPTEPWLNYDALTVIARGSGRFRSLSEHFSTFVPGLNHIVYSATVVDKDDFGYTRSGAASLGETLDGEEVNTHDLAATRALRKALDSAGFDVVKASSVVAIDLNLPKDEQAVQDETNSRLKDLRTIHMIAGRKGLIVPAEDDPAHNDMTAYRNWLKENFGVITSAGLSPANRAIAINLLRQLPDVVEQADLRTTN
jgi:hypothetical protein